MQKVWNFTILNGKVLKWDRSSADVESRVGIDIPGGGQACLSGGIMTEDQLDLSALLEHDKFTIGNECTLYHEAAVPPDDWTNPESRELKIRLTADGIELIGETYQLPPEPAPTPDPAAGGTANAGTPPAPPAPSAPPFVPATLPPKPAPKPAAPPPPPAHPPAAQDSEMLAQLRIIAAQGTDNTIALKQLAANTGTMCGQLDRHSKGFDKLDTHLACQLNHQATQNEHMKLLGECMAKLTESAVANRPKPETDKDKGGNEPNKDDSEKKKATTPVKVRKNYWPAAIAAIILTILGWYIIQKELGTPFGFTAHPKDVVTGPSPAQDAYDRDLASMRKKVRDEEHSSATMILTNGSQGMFLATNAPGGRQIYQMVNCTNVNIDNSVHIKESPTMVVPVPQYAPVSVQSAPCTHIWSGNSQPGQQAEKYVTPLERVEYVPVPVGSSGGGAYIAGSIGSIGLGRGTCRYPVGGYCGGGFYGGYYGDYGPRRNDGNTLVFNLNKPTYNVTQVQRPPQGGPGLGRPPSRPPVVCRPPGHR